MLRFQGLSKGWILAVPPACTWDSTTMTWNRSPFWWAVQIALSLLCSFFILFGISLLVAAYRLDNPAWFVMTFFSASLIILISGTLLLGIVVKVVASFKGHSDEEE